MSNFIVTNRRQYFEAIGKYNYIDIKDIILPKKISVDTETTSLKTFKGEIFAVQVGTGSNNYLFDIESIGIQPVIKLLENKILVFHNAIFDLGWFYKYGFFPWKVRDTLLASQILYNGLKEIRHGFGYVMERELGIEYDKSEQANIAKIKLSTDRAIQYCFNDVDKLLELDEKLSAKIIDGGYLPTYQLHRRWIRAAAYMEQCGLPIDENAWKTKIDSDKSEQKIAAKKVISYIYENLPKYRSTQLDLFSTDDRLRVDISSPLQMIKVFEDFGINIISSDKDEKTGKFKKSIAEDVISKTKHPFIDIWLNYQSITHDVTTFGENFLSSIYEGRVYTKYKPILDTARISSGGKNKNKTEPDDVNTLNIPANEKSRSPFKAKPGFKVVVADYEGQEAIVGADISGDATMISSVVNNACLHCAFARVLYPEIKDLTDQEIKEHHSDKRQDSKSPRFCFQFGGTGFTLHVDTGIPLDRAMEIENLYKELHSGIYSSGESKLDEVIKLGYIESTMGFKLHLPHFTYFKEKHRWLSGLSKSWWKDYKEGKIEYKAKKKSEENEKSYIVKNQKAFNLYRKNAKDISDYFKLKSKYFRLVLNNPTQTTAAHQTKSAINKVFEHIYKNNHFWKARIALTCHDEGILEVEDSLTKEYKKVLEEAMIQEGNKFLTNPLLKMKAEAFIHYDWYSAKKGEKYEGK